MLHLLHSRVKDCRKTGIWLLHMPQAMFFFLPMMMPGLSQYIYSFDYKDTPKGYWYNSQEIAFRKSSHLPLFDTRFGINSPKLGCGEEEVFLWQAHEQGLSVRYFPEVIVETDATTSRYQFYTDKRMQRAKGAVLCIMHGPSGAFLRCLKLAIVHALKHNPISLLWHMTYGIIYIRL